MRVAPAHRLGGPRAAGAVVPRPRARAGPSDRRRGSPRRARSARRPCRSSAPARRARSAVRRDRRAAPPTPGGAQRLPPTVALPAHLGVARSPTRSGRAGSSVDELRQGHHRADPDDVAVDAQLVEPAAVRAARCAPASADRRRAAAIRIVPPANTVTPSPSPNSSAASSAVVGTIVAAVMRADSMTADGPRSVPATLRRCRLPRSTSSSRPSPARRICPTGASRRRSTSR